MLLASRQFDDDAFTLDGLLVGWVLPAITPAVLAELRRLRVTLEPGGHGYHRLTGWSLTMIIVVLDEVSQVEHDALLGAFGHGSVETDEARCWWLQQTGVTMGKVDKLAGYEEMKAKFLASLSPDERLAGLAPETLLAGLAPEQRLAGLAPEQRLAGLAPEQRLSGLRVEQVSAALGPTLLLALPIEALRALPADYVATLPDDIRAGIAARLEGSATPRKKRVSKTGQRRAGPTK